VYAPASERVPVPPVAGDREFVDHPDEHTPERLAAGRGAEPAPATRPNGSGPQPVANIQGAAGFQSAPGNGSQGAPRFQSIPGNGEAGSRAGAQDAPSWQSGPAYQPALPMPSESRRPALFFGLGVSWLTVIGASVGFWLFLRWRRERNKPVNRLRRQARQTASLIRERVPTSREAAAKPALGLSAALASSLIVMWQQSRARHTDKAARKANRTARHAAEAVSDVDWYQQLAQLKQRWSPKRVELEKTWISHR
jgi:hypothetical protein